MLQMTALKRGVCVLPEWLANNKCNHLMLKKIRIGKNGMYKKLFLAIRENDKTISYIEKFIAVGKKMANKSF